VAFLSDILSQAKQQVVQTTKISAQSAINSARQSAQSVLQSAKNDAVNAASNAVGGAINAGVTGVVGAASAAITGNFDQAAQRLFDIPGAAAGAVSSVLGVGSGSILSSPGTSFTASSNLGIGEGNALYGALSRADPLTSIGWYAQVPAINSPYGNVSLPWYYIEQATTPFRNFDVASIFRSGRSKHYAGRYAVDNLTLTFYLDSAGQTLRYLNGWQSCIVNPTSMSNFETNSGNYMVPSFYKKPIFLYLLDPTRQEIAVIQYVECWPTNIDSLSLESDGVTRLVAAVNFSVGDVFVISTNASALSIQGILEAANPIPQLIQTVGSEIRNRAGSVIQNTVNTGVRSIASTVDSSVRQFF